MHHSIDNAKICKCLSKHFCASCRFRDIKILSFCQLKSKSRSRSAIFVITLFDSKCLNLQMSLHTRSYRFRYTKFFIIVLQISGQGQGVQFSQLQHFMENIKIDIYLPHIFVLALIVSNLDKIIIFTLKSRSSSQSTISAVMYFDGEYRNLQTSFW